MEVTIKDKGVALKGIFEVPSHARGAVIFAHGSGSSRLSPRNTFAAGVLQHAGFATLLMDLLTEEEDGNYETRFDIGLLTKRLGVGTKWLRATPEAKGLPLGIFGASTGAAAALCAAAIPGADVAAVVSRGGRPDLAMEALSSVKSPTLLIVGGDDLEVLEMNRAAYAKLGGIKKLAVVPGATHLFEEPGTLEEAAKEASAWFEKYLGND